MNFIQVRSLIRKFTENSEQQISFVVLCFVFNFLCESVEDPDLFFFMCFRYVLFVIVLLFSVSVCFIFLFYHFAYFSCMYIYVVCFLFSFLYLFLLLLRESLEKSRLSIKVTRFLSCCGAVTALYSLDFWPMTRCGKLEFAQNLQEVHSTLKLK